MPDPHTHSGHSPAPSGRVWPAAGRVFTRWKNGGGEMAQILTVPPGADIESFDWRISIAIVASSGPFSVFAGVDRVLTVLEGGPMRLRLPGGDQVLPPLQPFAFAGDLACSADLMGETVVDLNVMTRRPLRAEVTANPPAADPATLGLYALLLEDAAGFAREDLLEAAPETLPSGSRARWIRIFPDG